MNIAKEKKEALKKCQQLRAKIFGCAHDAEKEIQRIQKRLNIISFTTLSLLKNMTPGGEQII
jgi:hypothetical protein